MGARLTFVDITARATADVSIWNKVWTDPELVPTDWEIADPAAWLQRVGIAP